MSSFEEEDGFPSGSPEAAEAAFDSLSSLKSTLRARQLYACAWMALLIYDWLSMFPQEYKYIWRAKKTTPIKFVFLLNRYLSIIIVSISALMVLVPISKGLCDGIWWIQPVGGMIIVFLSSIIMAIRTAAIYSGQPFVVALLAVMVLSQAAWFAFVASLLGPSKLPEEIANIVNFPGCFIQPRNPRKHEAIAGLVWISPLCFDLIILVMTIYRSFTMKRRAGSIPLLRKLVGAGSFYFIVISLSNLVNVALYAVPNAGPSLETFHSGAADALTSILCCRLVLSLFDPSSHTYDISFTTKKSGSPSRTTGGGGGGGTNASPSFKLATLGIGSPLTPRGEDRTIEFEDEVVPVSSSSREFTSNRAMMIRSEEIKIASQPHPFESLDTVAVAEGTSGGVRLEKETVVTQGV